MKIRNILLTSLLAITSAFTTKALVKENTSIVRSQMIHIIRMLIRHQVLI